MRRYRANYWITLFYNGVVIGIWPAAAAAYLLMAYLHTLVSFLAMFVISMCIWIPFVMWLYHMIIW